MSAVIRVVDGIREGLMQMRKLANVSAAAGGLVELLDQLELALADSSPRKPVCKALFDLNRRLGTDLTDRPPTRAKRRASAQRGRRAVVESLPLFS
ncbi:hypothetical protein [Paraburkholderia fungorum]|nr:hypothetical protein [Paraburkholderia fungorum]